jgi:thiol-disulfide isomerase/thioredoxin
MRHDSGSEAVFLAADDFELRPGGLRLIHADRAAVAPPFSWTDEAGETVSRGSLAGRVVWINLWADWCATCRAEFPGLQRIHDRLADRGLALLAVCRNSTRSGFEAAVRKDWLTFPAIDATRDSDFPFPFGAFPTSVVLDRAGRVRAYWQGHRSLAAVETLLRDLLAEPPRPRGLEPGGDGSPRPASVADSTLSPRASDSVVRASLELPREEAPPGELVEGRLVLDVDPGWHLVGPEDPDLASHPLEIRIETSSPRAVFDHLRPLPRERELAGLTRSVYSGRVEFPLWGFVPADVPPGRPLALAVRTTLQACNETSCLLPAEILLSGNVRVADRSDR